METLWVENDVATYLASTFPFHSLGRGGGEMENMVREDDICKEKVTTKGKGWYPSRACPLFPNLSSQVMRQPNDNPTVGSSALGCCGQW